ncbi:MAG: DUF4440 domain-containing protein [Thiotrichales bacterium]|nr:DUF4440 domain-containing protein [Thiotrichales bacterium]
MSIFKYLFLLIFISFNSTATWAVADDSQVILDLTARSKSLLTSADPALLDSFYTSDAVMLPPSSEILSSHAEIKEYWEGLKGAGVRDYTIYPVSVSVDGDTAYQTALWEAVRQTRNGESIHLQGNISNVLIKQPNGSWKIKLQSWN